MEAGHYKIAKQLLNKGADVNMFFGRNKDTPLHLACMKASQVADSKKKENRDRMVDLLL